MMREIIYIQEQSTMAASGTAAVVTVAMHVPLLCMRTEAHLWALECSCVLLHWLCNATKPYSNQEHRIAELASRILPEP